MRLGEGLSKMKFFIKVCCLRISLCIVCILVCNQRSLVAMFDDSKLISDRDFRRPSGTKSFSAGKGFVSLTCRGEQGMRRALSDSVLPSPSRYSGRRGGGTGRRSAASMSRDLLSQLEDELFEDGDGNFEEHDENEHRRVPISRATDTSRAPKIEEKAYIVNCDEFAGVAAKGCPICQSDFVATDTIAEPLFFDASGCEIGCKHYFHRGCLITWFRTPKVSSDSAARGLIYHSTCPLCRVESVCKGISVYQQEAPNPDSKARPEQSTADEGC